MKAVILFSGGLDSTVALADAIKNGRKCYALSFNYSQSHIIELEAAKKIAAHYGIHHQIVDIAPETFASSALLGAEQVPTGRSLQEISQSGISSTYVPARNTLFLAYALGYSELLQAEEIYIGANLMDREGYPDCRPAFLEAFQKVINLGTKMGVEGCAPKIITPLVNLNKRQIVAYGKKLKAPLELSWSCYHPTNKQAPCRVCDACCLRLDAFAQ